MISIRLYAVEQLSEPVASSEDGGSQATAPDIRLRGVRKSYGDVVAVDGIDLEVANGEFFTMLGPVRARARRRPCG